MSRRHSCSSSSQVSASTLVEVIEQCRCPQCDGIISDAHRLSEFPFRNFVLVKVITAWCEHCDIVWRARFHSRGGVYQLEGMVEKVTAPKDRLTFLRRIEAKSQTTNSAA